jgi:hypothetical protein
MNPSQPLRRADAFYVGALFLLTLLMFLPYLLPPTPLIFSNSDFGTDLTQELYPMVSYVRDSLRETGTLPLWRSYHLSGTPLIGHPVAPVFYPVHWLVMVLPLPLALNLDAMLHLWWAGVGLYLCLRLLRGMRSEPAFLAAILFAHTPRLIAHLAGGHWALLASVAWWAWVWLAFHRYMQTRHLAWAVLLGIALASQAMNDGKYLIMSVVALAPCPFFYIERGKVQQWLIYGLLGGVVAVLVTFGLSAAQMLPFIDLLPYTQRTNLGIAEATAGLPVPLLMLLVLPWDMKIAEWVIFPGTALTLLLLYSFASGWTRRDRWLALGSTLLLILNLGRYGGLYYLLYQFVPLFTLLRSTERFFPLALFGMVILAADGAEKWLNGRPPARWFWRVVGVWVLIYGLMTGVGLFAPTLFQFNFIPYVVTLPLMVFILRAAPDRRWFYAVCLIALVELWWFDIQLARPESEENAIASSPVTMYLVENLGADERVFAPYADLPDMETIATDMDRADGYDPTHLAAYGEFVSRAGGCDFNEYSVGAPVTRASADAVRACPEFIPQSSLLALLNVRYVVLRFPIEGATPVMTTENRYVYELEEGVGRAFGVTQTESADAAQCVDRLLEVDVRTTAIVESALPTDSDGQAVEVLSHERFPNGETFTVRGEGLLVRSESWAPGWNVTVDGLVGEVLRVDCTLQGVWLPEGEHVVRFEYLPRSYVIGRWITLATVGVLLLWGAGWLLRRQISL